MTTNPSGTDPSCSDGAVSLEAILDPPGGAEHQPHDIPDPVGLFDGDTGDAPANARTIITYLTRNRVLLGRDEPDLWDMLVTHEARVTRHFHNMYVDLTINRAAKVAFKQQVAPDRAAHWVVVRAVTLTREASVLALHARERIAHAMPGETVLITHADAREQMEPYWPAQVSNRAAKEKKVNGAIDSLVQQDLLLKRGDDQWEVSPALPLVLTAEATARFTDLLTAPDTADEPHLTRVPAPDPEPDEPEDDRQ